LFAISDIYLITKDLDDRKTILGYDCYKVQLERKNYEEELEDFTTTFYDMYVTESIDLPMHALLNITKEFPEFFPLEIKIWQPNVHLVIENFHAIEIN